MLKLGFTSPLLWVSNGEEQAYLSPILLARRNFTKIRIPSKHVISVVESYPMACGFQDVSSLTDWVDDILPQYTWPAFAIKQRA